MPVSRALRTLGAGAGLRSVGQSSPSHPWRGPGRHPPAPEWLRCSPGGWPLLRDAELLSHAGTWCLGLSWLASGPSLP